MIRDAEHFSIKMSKIEGSGDLGEYTINLVKSKALPEKEAPPAPAAAAEEKKDEPQGDVMFDAADPITPTQASGSISSTLETQELSTKENEGKAAAETDPPLPPTPEQLGAEEKKKQIESGDSSPTTASKQAKLSGIEAANEVNEAMGKELPPTPMEVDERDRKMGGGNE